MWKFAWENFACVPILILMKIKAAFSIKNISNHNDNDNEPSSSDQQHIAKTTSAMHCTTYSQVPFKTAINTVHAHAQVSMDENILFNEGTRRSFIYYRRSIGQLEIEWKGSEIIFIYGFRGGTESVRHLKTAELFVHIEDGNNIQPNILIVPAIASPIRKHTTEITN